MTPFGATLGDTLQSLSTQAQSALALQGLIESHGVWLARRAARTPSIPAPPIPTWVANSGAMTPWLNRMALLRSMITHEPQIDRQSWPEPVKALCRDEFKRMLQAVETAGDDYFDSDAVRFLEDVRVASFSRISLGACYAEVAGVPRSWVLKTGPVMAARLTRYLMTEAGGFRPFLDLHVNAHRLDEFNAEGWDRAWRLAAGLTALNPGLRGIQCSAWFNDPGLAWISPRLSYLRQRYVDGGGVCFRVGGEQDERMLSLIRSPTRRALFAQGRYAPCVYMCVWAKRPLMVWAEKR